MLDLIVLVAYVVLLYDIVFAYLLFTYVGFMVVCCLACVFWDLMFVYGYFMLAFVVVYCIRRLFLLFCEFWFWLAGGLVKVLWFVLLWCLACGWLFVCDVGFDCLIRVVSLFVLIVLLWLYIDIVCFNLLVCVCISWC